MSTCSGYVVNSCGSCIADSNANPELHDYKLHEKHDTFDKCTHLSEEEDPKTNHWNSTQKRE